MSWTLVLPWLLPVVVTGPIPRSQFVLLLGAVVPGLKVSTSSLVVVRQVVVIATQAKPYNGLLPVLAPLDHVLVLVPFRGTLGFVAFHFIFLKSVCGTGRFLTFISH